MKYIRRRDPSCVWYGLAAPPEDVYGAWTCRSCGRVIRRDEPCGWRDGELQCETCLEETYDCEN